VPLSTPPPIALPPGLSGGSILLFAPDRARLALLLALSHRRVQAVLWLLVVGMGLGFLWLIPKVHALPHHTDPSPLLRALHSIAAVKGQLWWVVVLRALGMLGPAGAVISFFWLPGALWREAHLRRQSNLHLAVGRQ